MNSFGSHDGKIDPVFLPLPKKVVKQRMWLSKLERKLTGFWDGRSPYFAVLLEILSCCLVFLIADLLVIRSRTF
jgi:hypothetical protein